MDRFVAVVKSAEVERRFNLTDTGVLKGKDFKHYNIAPGVGTAVLTNTGALQVQFMQFGYTRPPGGKVDRKIDYKHIIFNQHFRLSMLHCRCLVMASAFYYQALSANPYLVFMPRSTLFNFAGIYNPVGNFGIITCPPNSLLSALGAANMPVIIKHGSESRWLAPNATLAELTHMLKPFNPEWMNAYPIEPVNPELNMRALLNRTGHNVRRPPEPTVREPKRKKG